MSPRPFWQCERCGQLAPAKPVPSTTWTGNNGRLGNSHPTTYYELPDGWQTLDEAELCPDCARLERSL